MQPGAAVDSVALLQDWHDKLCIFRADAADALSAIALEIRRAEDYLDDMLRHWQRLIRRFEQEVAQAKIELFNRRFPDFSGRIPDCTVQEENLAQAERRLEHARRQVELVRRWMQRLPNAIAEVYLGPGKRLSHFIEGELQRGIHLLERRIEALQAYLKLAPPANNSGAAPL